MRRSVKKLLVGFILALIAFSLSACSNSSSSSYNPKDYDRKFDSSEFGEAREVWDSINGK